MKVIVITQARSGSTRLPNKVLKEINGKSLLQVHINRIKQAKLVDDIFIATTIDENDDQIVNLAKRLNVKYYRGSENDVLDRFFQTAKSVKPDYVVRLTSDCPLIDPILLDEIIEETKNQNVDYYSNIFEQSYPDGQDIEVFKFYALEKAWKEATLKSDREHVTPYIRNNSTYKGATMFTSNNHGLDVNYNKVRITVDELRDFEVIKRLIEDLGVDKDWKTYADHYLNNQEIQAVNSQIIRNEGYLKSIREDKDIY